MLRALRAAAEAVPVRAPVAAFDVVVAGGGPAGATCAAACAKRGLSVLLVERSGYDAPRIGETLPPGARDLLARVGVWEAFAAAGHRPAYAMRSAWGDAEPVAHDYLFHPHGRGWQIDRRRFDAMIADAAEQAGAVRRRAHVRGCRRAGEAWIVELDDGEPCAGVVASVMAHVVVDATGRAARVARGLGARREASDALIGAFARTPGRDDGGALIEAIEHGWWYSARVPDGDLVVAFMTDADLWARHRDRWPALLERAPHTRARVAGELPAPRVAAAASSCLAPIGGPGWISVGDAAMAFDPLSGQGICRAIASGERAAGAIARARAGDDGAFAALADTERAQYASYLATRARFYALEPRFAGSPFWDRRAAPPRHSGARSNVPAQSYT